MGPYFFENDEDASMIVNSDGYRGLLKHFLQKLDGNKNMKQHIW